MEITWIPVEEKLPEEIHLVLAWCTDDIAFNLVFAFFDGEEWRCFPPFSDNFRTKAVSHWMEILEGPDK